MLEKCVLTILELTWNQRLGHKTKLNICHHMLTSSTQLQNKSFHVIERTRTSSKCQKLKKCTCKACKNTVFHRQICKFVGFLLPWSCLLHIKLWVWICLNNKLAKRSLYGHFYCSTTSGSFVRKTKVSKSRRLADQPSARFKVFVD